MNNDDLMSQITKDFADGQMAWSDIHDLYREDVKFGIGDQWTSEDKVLRANRPMITINKVGGSIKQMIGKARRNRPRIKVTPVDSRSDPNIASIINGLIRNIEEVSDSAAAYDCGFNCAARGGIGHWRIYTKFAEDSFDQEIVIERIVNPLNVIVDPMALNADFDDARYAILLDIMTKEEFEEEYPDSQPVDFTGHYPTDFKRLWMPGDLVVVAEYFYKEKVKAELFELVDGRVICIENPKKSKRAVDGDSQVSMVYGDGFLTPMPYKRSRKITKHRVMWCKSNGHEIIEGPTEFPSKYIPVITVMGDEVWTGDERILRSAIADAKDAARLYNWARSNMVEILAQAAGSMYHVTPDEVQGHEAQWNQSHVQRQAYRLFNDAGLGRPQPSAPNVPDIGSHREAMISSDDIKACTGYYDASLGASGNEVSGLAINSRQVQTDNSSFVFMDNWSRAIKFTAKILTDMIQRLYTSERVHRVVNEEGQEAWANVNVVDPITGKITNDLSVGKYDVTFEVGPDFISRRAEAAEGLAKIAQTAPQYVPALVPKIVKNLDWPGADRIGEELMQLNKPQPNPVEQAKVQVDMEKLKTDQMTKQIDLEMKKIDFDIKRLELGKKKVELGGKVLDTGRKITTGVQPGKPTGGLMPGNGG
jgi:hypothetical protein